MPRRKRPYPPNKPWQFQVANQFSLKFEMDSDKLAIMRDLWENTPATAEEIAVELSVTKNVVIGYANRRHWVSFTPGNYRNFTSFDERLDDMHSRMDELIAATPPRIKPPPLRKKRRYYE